MKKTLVWMMVGSTLVLGAMGGALLFAQQTRAAETRSPQTRLEQAMQLNRTGDWREAAREAEAVAVQPGLTAELKCWALESAAYSRLRLHDEAAAGRHLEALTASWGALPESHWIRREGRQLQMELTSPVEKGLRQALHQNRSGDWEGARVTADRVLAMADLTVEQRVRAHNSAAWAALRLGDRPTARRHLAAAEAAIASLPETHWLHGTLSPVKAELKIN